MNIGFYKTAKTQYDPTVSPNVHKEVGCYKEYRTCHFSPCFSQPHVVPACSSCTAGSPEGPGRQETKNEKFEK